MILLKYCWKWR